MFNFMTMLSASSTDKAVPAWVESSFPVIKIVLACLILACSIVMIVINLCQKTEADGTNAITGQADTFYNRNKGGSLQGKIKKLTIILAICLMVLCVVYFVMNSYYQG